MEGEEKEGDENDNIESKNETDTHELVTFRSQWRQELGLESCKERRPESATKEGDKGDNSNPQNKSEDTSSEKNPQEQQGHTSPSKTDAGDMENEATRLYWMGVAAEQSGDMDGAILFYRQAVQLDPDVEVKASRKGPPANLTELDEDEIKAENCESSLVVQLTEEFQQLSLNTFCQPRKTTKEVHISALPVEVLRYIFRWVVSSLLDMRTIEQLSMVCKGFYLLAREPQLWRTACRRLWDDYCPPSSYGSWRKMFILKPHLHFNGVYISKTSYVRQGEHSLDGFYRPYHTVTYFRYLRFFADGNVMYQTTPEEPSQVVSKLCHKHSSEAVLLGKYQVCDRNVLIDLISVQKDQSQNHRHYRGRGRGKTKQEITHEQRFHMELLLDKRKTKQLTWIKHHCTTIHIPTGQEQTCEFSINYMYTPFYFSRVKSFTINSVGMLK